MATNVYGKSVDRLRGISTKAFDQAGAQVGKSSDVDLNLYEQLKPKHFEALVQKYGADEILRYIKVMEAKRQGA